MQLQSFIYCYRQADTNNGGITITNPPVYLFKNTFVFRTLLYIYITPEIHPERDAARLSTPPGWLEGEVRLAMDNNGLSLARSVT
ncbi:hypothetical protein A6U85_19355 [Agrobacterium sp. 13-626]|nr:hypothetical protein DXT98_17035 [Agrobacterium sp. ICMP 7243]OCI93368.1 hypothetical protein A6U85_19355 [Agrobacterium sp. 13-626]